jgi:hypothetical protein
VWILVGVAVDDNNEIIVNFGNAAAAGHRLFSRFFEVRSRIDGLDRFSIFSRS